MSAASQSNLPHPPDLSPGGQLALPGADGQLGLDGRVYGHARALPAQIQSGVGIEGRSPEPILGTNAEFCTQCKTEPAPDNGGGLGLSSTRQLVLDLGDTEAIPQLSLFERQRSQRYVLVKNLGRDVAWKLNLHK